MCVCVCVYIKEKKKFVCLFVSNHKWENQGLQKVRELAQDHADDNHQIFHL